MKLKMVGVIVASLVLLGYSAFAEESAVEVGSETMVVDSEQMLGECLISVQRQYFPVCLPSLTERLLQPAGSFPVVWDSFSPETRQQFQGWIDGNGIVHYAVGLYEDYWTGEIVVLDDSGWEIFRIGREKTYDPYDLQREFFDLGKKEVLEDEFTRAIFLPSKICTVADLVPLVFWDTHLQIEQELATQEALLAAQEEAEDSSSENETVSVGMSLVPAEMVADSFAEGGDLDGGMAMMSSTPPPPPGGGGGGSSTNGGTSNLVVELAISLPEGYGNGYIEIFTKDDLVYSPSWTMADGWVPTYGEQTVYYIDPASSNKQCRFYRINGAAGAGSDSDGDGRSDFYESITGTDSNTYNFLDLDYDLMSDWWEERFFGSLSYDGGDDPDGDGIATSNEFLYLLQPPKLITDPSMYSSDNDALSDMEMFGLSGAKPTDPWNGDVSKPTASILWPTNNAVVVF